MDLCSFGCAETIYLMSNAYSEFDAGSKLPKSLVLRKHLFGNTEIIIIVSSANQHVSVVS